MTAVAESPSNAIRVSAVRVDDVVRLLERAGVAKADELVREHIGAGLPRNEDGSVNLVQYAAWLLRQSAAPGEVSTAPTPAIAIVSPAVKKAAPKPERSSAQSELAFEAESGS